VSAASVHRARRPPPSKERCKKLFGRRSATRTVASGAMEGATDKHGVKKARSAFCRASMEPDAAVLVALRRQSSF